MTRAVAHGGGCAVVRLAGRLAAPVTRVIAAT